ncbi:hypothetical protein DENSPDRAFT_885044 [Dentipellis sp. KUC8613]|nr:hypothetical protein DENSPDRAFT_885044 [Dentipellis sp. KUC8613]
MSPLRVILACARRRSSHCFTLTVSPHLRPHACSRRVAFVSPLSRPLAWPHRPITARSSPVRSSPAHSRRVPPARTLSQSVAPVCPLSCSRRPRASARRPSPAVPQPCVAVSRPHRPHACATASCLHVVISRPLTPALRPHTAV